MNAERLLKHYEKLADVPESTDRLRGLILDLAIRGKLLEQNSEDESASDLLKRIEREKERLGIRVAHVSKLREESESEDFPIPSTWCWSRISDIGVLNPRTVATDDAPASFVSMHMIPAEYGQANQHKVRAWREIRKGYTHFKEGDVGLAKITPCFENGKSTVFRNLAGGIGSGTTELHIVRPLLVDGYYVLLFLKSPHFLRGGIPKMTGTAGQKRVPLEYFANTPFPLPPSSEQHRIVAKVNELMTLCDRFEVARQTRDSARNRLTAASYARLGALESDSLRTDVRFALDSMTVLTADTGQIKNLRKSILNLAVSGRLVTQDAKDEPAVALLSRVKEDISKYGKENQLREAKPSPISLEDIPFPSPSGWEWVRLCELFKVITDGDHQPPPRADEGVAFLTIGNITTGKLDFADCRMVPENYYSAIASYRRPQKGDILYTVVGATYGRPAVVDTDRPFCVQRHIAILKPAEALEMRYLSLLLASPLIYDQASGSTTGTAQPTVALRPLRDFLAPVPPVVEQRRIVATVNQLMIICDQLERVLTGASEKRTQLLSALLAEALESAEPAAA